MYSQTERGLLILTRLGLTQYQARVLLALEQSGMTNANSVAIASRVPREKVYGVLHSLMEMGLVNKVITSPTAYKALRIDEAVALLTDIKQKNLKKLTSEINVLVKDYKSNLGKISNAEDFSIFEYILGKDVVLNYVVESITKAEVCIDAVVAWKNNLNVPQFVDLLRKANRRGINIRVVFQLPQYSRDLEDFLQTNDMSFCKYLVLFTPVTFMQIYDAKRALIFTHSGYGLKESPAIITNNASFLEVANTYFRSIWQQRQPHKA